MKGGLSQTLFNEDYDGDIDPLWYCHTLITKFLSVNTFFTQSLMHLFSNRKHSVKLHFSVCNYRPPAELHPPMNAEP